ncbi:MULTISPECIES: hypothetical protein [Brevibacillus]|uniref:hypothetical protein n=1 Tax=Brevibacillus TaxID=55080 RepID=UPI000271B2B2|nr:MULTISPECIES: hypothetical protein [Brevibacillus]ELK39361.1 hypothetical protein D478_24858 [Brevibacillus agri BAB-2500]EJL46953.1 hypothetical protein PMI08_00840 [Brevibacillus sp. CF112]MBY0052053.1 hypothetical protein [Brevibacillus agri]MCG5252708.1 hypothetical protein [Brevibacillus agri]MDN4093983.1 hypothetical protein [Brevibacillus agri]
MNKKWMKPAAFLVLAGVVGVAGLNLAGTKAAHAASEKGKLFAAADELKLDKNTYVIDVKSADVNGDKLEDTVFLVGQKEKADDIYASNMNIVVQDGKSKTYSATDIKELGGYEGELTLVDFTGDHVADAFVKTATGGSGGIYHHVIATFANNKPTVIFGEKENEGIRYEGKFVNGFKVEGKGAQLDKPLSIDVSANQDVYMAAKLYDKAGKVQADGEDVTVYSYPFGSLTPIDMDGNGTYELAGQQRIVGMNNTDTVSRINSVWGYQGAGKWNPWEVEYSTFLVKHPGEAINTTIEK